MVQLEAHDTLGVQFLTLQCVCAGGLAMARELMAITGLTARALVILARSAFSAAAGAVGTARAVSLGVFLNDGVTGDVRGLNLLGNPPPPQLTYIPTHKYNRVHLCVVHLSMHTFIHSFISVFIHPYVLVLVCVYMDTFVHL